MGYRNHPYDLIELRDLVVIEHYLIIFITPKCNVYYDFSHNISVLCAKTIRLHN